MNEPDPGTDLVPPARAEYEGFKVFALKPAVVYGPIETRRKGRSLGVNLLPGSWKVCSFNCVYCQLGWTRGREEAEQTEGHPFPLLDTVRGEIDDRFAALRASGDAPDTIVLSGNGEPTMHPDFPAAVDLLLAARDRCFPGVPVEILTNGSRLHRPEVRAACLRLDRTIVKMDTGTPRGLRTVNIPVDGSDLERITEAAAAFPEVILQACFVRGSADNTGPEEVEAWIARIGRIRPARVQVYSLDRRPAAPGLERVPLAWLEELARRLTARTRVPAEAY